MARILSKTPEEFTGSDIVTHALDLLEASNIERIVLLGRRGPHQIMMTPKELGELSHLTRAAPRVDPADLPEEGEDALLESAQLGSGVETELVEQSLACRADGARPSSRSNCL